MAATQVNRAKFAAYIARLIRDARTRGMTDQAIHDATGVSPATFHRWQSLKGSWRTPQLDKVKRFCEGLGANPSEALRELGIDERPPAPPEPVEMPPVFREVLRRLYDPNTPPEEKYLIEQTIAALAARPKPATGARQKNG